jgi:type VI secretion system protein ImpF
MHRRRATLPVALKTHRAMAETAGRDRLQPSLLDRLIDSDPQSKRETADQRVLSRQQLRAAVLRDLAWLFNTTRNEPEPNSDREEELALWAQHDHARRSALNFGMPAFAGNTLSTMDTAAMEASVKQAIIDFEPRIDANTLDVEVNLDARNKHNALQLTIRGQMWNQPVPLELLLAAQVDLETGSTSVRDLRA